MSNRISNKAKYQHLIGLSTENNNFFCFLSDWLENLIQSIANLITIDTLLYFKLIEKALFTESVEKSGKWFYATTLRAHLGSLGTSNRLELNSYLSSASRCMISLLGNFINFVKHLGKTIQRIFIKSLRRFIGLSSLQKLDRTYKGISIPNFSASSLYRFLTVTSVTPAVVAISFWVLLSPHTIEAM